MSRATSRISRFIPIVVASLVVLVIPVPLFASGEDNPPVVPDPGLPIPQPLAPLATVTLTCLDGTTACHGTTLRASVAGDMIQTAQVVKLRWKKGTDDWVEYNYTTQQGPTPPTGPWQWNAQGSYFALCS